MSNTYINLIKGEDIEMSDDKFAESYITFEQFKSDFFSDRKVEILNINKLGGNTTEFDFIYNEVPFHCVFLNLKNSGINKSDKDKVNKRMQIGANFTYYDDTIPQYVIGSYNTVDKILYFVVELKEYIKNKKNLGQKDYSSFWIDYGNIYFTYEKGLSRYVDKRNGRIIIGISKEKLTELEDLDLINSVFINEGYYENEYEKRNNYNKLVEFEENESTVCATGKKLKRNPNLRQKVFEREGYKCELCGQEHTFLSENGTEYFEGHHLIMYNFSSQKKYKYNLDNESNIICLCPTCHRKIHHATPDVIFKSVIKLMSKHSDLFDLYEIENIDKILEEYKTYERDDDNE